MMMIIMGHQCEREIGLRGISGEGGGKETILRGEEDQNMLHTHTHTQTHIHVIRKTSKFLVSHLEESIAGHMGITGVY
jgi:hypothetical protein